MALILFNIIINTFNSLYKVNVYTYVFIIIYKLLINI